MKLKSMNSLKHLHEKTLTQVELDWIKGAICINLISDYTHEKIQIVGNGLTSFSCDRKFPWGPSDLVNEVKIEQNADEAILTIEMQSGDLIIGKGASFEVSKE
jgi:hypothetical protein